MTKAYIGSIVIGIGFFAGRISAPQKIEKEYVVRDKICNCQSFDEAALDVAAENLDLEDVCVPFLDDFIENNIEDILADYGDHYPEENPF